MAPVRVPAAVVRADRRAVARLKVLASRAVAVARAVRPRPARVPKIAHRVPSGEPRTVRIGLRLRAAPSVPRRRVRVRPVPVPVSRRAAVRLLSVTVLLAASGVRKARPAIVAAPTAHAARLMFPAMVLIARQRRRLRPGTCRMFRSCVVRPSRAKMVPTRHVPLAMPGTHMCVPTIGKRRERR